MSTTIQYKGNTLTTVSNATKTLKTAGKYMEGDVSITDSSGNEQGTVWQDAEGYLHLDDESGISLQTKTATPSESAQTIKPDAGYYALEEVNVGAISSSYVGSGITRRSSSDLTASGATVSVPAGYYSSSASKSVASGTAGTPTATKGSVSNHSVSVTPSVTNTTGYITGGTKNGTAVSVSASELVSGTLNIASSGTTDVTNYASASVASGSATASATKGTVSNHSISVTPSVTRTAGYITAGSSNGTAVTVSASELVSGTKTITENGTSIDVTNYASVDVDVPSSSPTLVTRSITSNGTYSASSIWAASKTTEAGTTTGDGIRYIFSEYSSVDDLPLIAGNTYHVTGTIERPGKERTYTIDSDVLYSGSGTKLTFNEVGMSRTTTATIVNYKPVGAQSNVAVVLAFTSDDDTLVNPFTINFTADGFSTVTVNVSGGGVNVDDYKSIIERTATTPVLPSTLTKIGNYAFHSCTNLALTSLPDGVTSIGGYAFYSCATLALTSLPSGLTSIGPYAFRGCANLALTSLPDGVTIIGNYTFYGCTKLALTSLPDGVTSIGSYAFYGCTKLALTSLPDVVAGIGGYAFYNCTNIEVLSIPSGVSTISGSTFWGCNKLGTIILRKTDSVCSLANVNALTNTPIRGYNSLTGKIYVPSALIESYKTATNWSTIYNAGTVEFLAIEGSEYEE